MSLKCQNCDIGTFGHFTSCRLKARRPGQAERLRALEVDDEFVCRTRRAGQWYCLQ